jgi:hypothetical protein
LDDFINKNCVFFKRNPSEAEIPVDINVETRVDEKLYKELIRKRIVTYKNQEIIADTPTACLHKIFGFKANFFSGS